MNVEDLGHWSSYRPEPPPNGIPSTAAFCRRDSDGADWYEFRKELQNDNASVKLTVMRVPHPEDRQIVMVATRDASRLFPAGMLLLKIDDFDGDDPQATFGQKEYLPDSKSFQTPPPPLMLISDVQLFQALAMNGLITQDEALAAVSRGDLPKIMRSFIDDIDDDKEHFAAQMFFSGMALLDPNRPLLGKFFQAMGLNDDQFKEFWRMAMTL